MQCVFCKIIKGEIDSAKVFEDNDVFAFLDINPLTKGHCLVVPKKHSENIFDIDEDILQKIVLTGKHISEKIKNTLHVDGINLSQSSGSQAGQVIFHFHLHIIPRYQNDGISMNETGNASPLKADIKKLKELAELIKN